MAPSVMIQRVLYLIAGVDHETLASCPGTDRLWAKHLGFSLLLSFLVVLGITFHATGYLVVNFWMRLLVSAVVALTLFMFDRALYQSDWFFQGAFWPGDNGQGANLWTSLRRFLRIAIRLSISIGLAWVIAVFLELAIFDDTISEKIKQDHLAVNQPIYAKVEQYEAKLASEIEQRRSSLVALEELYRWDLTVDRTTPPQADDRETQIKALDDEIKKSYAQEQELRAELRKVSEAIAGFAQDMNAERLGQRVNPTSSGRAGAGPRYQFALQQKEVYEARQTSLQDELLQWRTKGEALTAQQQRLTQEADTRLEREHATTQASHDKLRAQVDAARAELKQLEGSRLGQIEAFRRNALSASDFQKQKDDPLSRMTAYQALKNDPRDGATIVLFSWMTKFLVIFLEIVPVVAKMFFSPPSGYAAKIQAEVERVQEKARLSTEFDFELPGGPDPRLAFSGLKQGAELDWALASSTSRNGGGEPSSGAELASRAGNREKEMAKWMRTDEIERLHGRVQQEIEANAPTAAQGSEKAAVHSLDTPATKVDELSMGEGKVAHIRPSHGATRSPAAANFSERDSVEPVPLLFPFKDDIAKKS